MRPGHLALTVSTRPGPSPPQADVADGVVRAVEVTGALATVTVEIDGHRLKARELARRAPATGDRVDVRLDRDAAHVVPAA
ncbi:MAG: TOBE domain-containing protein [Acidobacteriota bacterium]